jgi:hypothetical protein
MPRTARTASKTPAEVRRYFSGKSIKCLICGQRFQRLGRHLAAKHRTSVDDYRARFGLPWSRGLTAATSRSASAWTTKRKNEARKLARKSRFFELAHLTPRRELAPSVRTQAIRNLGDHAVGFGKAFKKKVRTLSDKGLTDAAIARKFKVGRGTVTYCAMAWRKAKAQPKHRDLAATP